MEYIIFDDNKWRNFLPFTYLRSISDLRVGVLKLRQRIGHLFDFDPTSVIVRKELTELYRQRHSDWSVNILPQEICLFINSRLRLTNNYELNLAFKEQIDALNSNEKLVFNNEVIAFKAYLNTDIITSEVIELMTKNFTEIQCEIPLWQYSWEFIHENGNLITYDYEQVFYEEDDNIAIEPGVTALNPYDIWIGEGAILKQGVILDASTGPIIIDEKACIMHNVVILGPAYIGKNSIIKIGAKIYPNTSIGPFCKIGGEVEDCVIQAYTNKQHDGFLGHSFIGEWVNLGADTNNSDLKNTYKPVKVWFYPEKKKISTESMFIGAFIGDHSKIGINCSINTGAMIGFGANIYGKDLISDFIPSFSWGEANNLIEYKFEKFVETARNVKIRRKENLVSEELKLIELINKNKKLYEDKNV